MIALIGYEPHLHELASYLLAGDAGRVRLTFKKGGVARLSFEDGLGPGTAALRWLLSPRALALMAKSGEPTAARRKKTASSVR